jgi:hypothetical protein
MERGVQTGSEFGNKNGGNELSQIKYEDHSSNSIGRSLRFTKEDAQDIFSEKT